MKNHIIIKCIKAGGLDHRLSLHKEYVVIDESDIMYLIKDDHGEETSFRKYRFEIIDVNQKSK